jgi:hypothetical protein
MAEQVLMGRFNYLSTYWDSVGMRHWICSIGSRMITVEHSWSRSEMAQEKQDSVNSRRLDGSKGENGFLGEEDAQESHVAKHVK